MGGTPVVLAFRRAREWARHQRASGGYDRWVRRTDVPLMLLALLFLAVLLEPLMVPSEPRPVRVALAILNIAIWLVFAIDYVVRLYLALTRWRFVRHHVPDLIVVVVPMLRPLRSLRLLRLLRLAALAGRVGEASRRNLYRRAAVYVTVVSVLMLFVAAAAMLLVERDDPDANIDTFPDALWWATTTITTVGYGDRFPVTASGRFVATGLMVVGIALLGVITASVAAWFVGQLSAAREDVEEAIGGDTARVLAAIAELQERIDRLEDRLPPKA